MRIGSIAIIAILLAAPAHATKPTPDTPDDGALAGGPILFEENTYRFGNTLRSEPGTSAEACAQLCSEDTRCAAWSLTAKTYTREPRCEMKTNPGARSYRPGTVSGLSEHLQMEAARDAEMRYRVSVPESRQPAAVPLDQLKPSPVPRMFGDPLPKSEPELLGGSETKISAIVVPAAPRSPSAGTAVDSKPMAISMTLRAPKLAKVPTER